MSRIVVDFQNACESRSVPDEAELQQWAEAGWQGAVETEITLRVVDETESAELNSRYRGKNSPTNVLSFPFDVPEGVELDLLGDLVICADVVKHEAEEQGKTLQAHWAQMVIHGMLHLQGYDHQNDQEAEIMESLEVRLLGELGFPDPYQ
ncbi:putative rRNA maturation factor [Halospina denitrificans]|uniref:Endoribonuclease YbeY n=1 Tax=Halospina denitrificans TaxID=332522 RepID=A0A4V3EQT2_9GAMM|nr:rRNA maturation RNase YbeY [Halospina denitrificans]TDT43268.1 putative rRNA maturation factor [Halospina denitrificans]